MAASAAAANLAAVRLEEVEFLFSPGKKWRAGIIVEPN